MEYISFIITLGTLLSFKQYANIYWNIIKNYVTTNLTPNGVIVTANVVIHMSIFNSILTWKNYH